MISLVPHILVFLLALKAHKSKSLTPLGIAASIITGLIHTSHPWIVYFLLLAGFYLSSSKFTKLKSDIKSQLTIQIDAGKNDSTHQEQRTHIQVFANSIVASILILLHRHFIHNDLLVIGIISHYAAVTADTWSSELGILSKSEPILITTLKKCPKGTNGGVSPLGLGVALLAGIYISILSIVALKLQGITISALDGGICSHMKFIVFFGIIGLFGSLLDSLLGAVFQKSVVNEKGLILEAKGGGIVKGGKEDKSKIISGQLNILSNNQVNLLMAFLTSLAGMGLWKVPVSSNGDGAKGSSRDPINAIVGDDSEEGESSEQKSNSKSSNTNKNKEQDLDVDKVPSAVNKPLDPPPFKHDEQGFKDKDMPTDEYQLKDNNVAVAPKPPGSAGSSKDSSKEGAAKVPQSGPGVKDGIPPPPPKNPQSKDKSADAKEASVNNDDNISPVLSSKKGSDLVGISYQKPTKDDFLNLEVVTSGGANTRLKSMKNKVLELLPSVKLPRKERYPVEKVADLPTASKTIPKIQAEKFHEESKEEKAARLNRLDKIKEVFLISWNQYKKFAWGKDEIKPVSQEGFDPFAGWSATLVDSLDTLIIMGLNDQFNEALNVVRDIDFSTTFRKDIPLFETVIRYLGGLLSAYDLADPKPPILLEKAVQLGDNLLGAFDTPNRMPKISFLWTEEAQKIKYRASSSSPFAEIGSMSVEFTRLAQLSGNSSYYDAIDRVTNAIYAMAPNNDIPYLFDQKVDASGCKLVPLPGTSKAETDPSNSNPESVPTGAKSQQPLKEDPYDVYEKAFKLDGDSEPIEEEDEEISSTDKKLASEIQSKAEELTKLSQDDDTTEAKKPSLDSIDDTPASKKKIAPGIKPPIRGSRDPLSLFSEEDIGSLGKVRKGSDVALREAAKRVNRKGWQKRAYIGDVDDEMVAEAKKIAQAAVKEAEAGLDTVSDSAKKNLKGVKSKAELAKEKVEKAASDAKSVVDDEMVREAKKIAQAAEEEVEAGLDTVSDSAKKNLEGVKSKAELAKEKVEKAASDVKSAVEDTLASTAEKAKEVIDDVPGKAAAAAERAKEILDDIPTNAASAVTSEISKESQSTASEPSSLKDAIEAEEKVNNAPSIILESAVAAVEPTSTASSKENDEIVAESKAVEKEANVGLSAGKTDIKTVIAQLGRGRKALFACEPQPALTKVNGKFYSLLFTSFFYYYLILTFILDVHSTPKYTVGGLTDSTYEYFAKEYLLLNGADDRYKELHTNTINAVNENLLFKPLVEGDPDILMVGNKIQRTPGFFQEDNEMSHLSCFIGGMYALGGKVFDRPEDVEAGAKLTDGCVWAYNVTRSGVMPENFHVRRCPEGDEKCHFDFETVDAEYKAREEVELKKLAAKGVDTKLYNPSTYSVSPNVEVVPDGRGGTRWPVNGYYDMPRSFLRMDAKYIMRPEALESVFYLYRITGEAAWQEKGWRMFESIINLTAIPDPAGGEDAPPIGYSGVQDVSDDRGTKGNFRNEAESFWMAETLKYAYLLFSDPNVIALDDWVLNTEAHPLKRTIEKQ